MSFEAPRRSRTVPIRKLRDDELGDSRPDTVAIEEPLQIRLSVEGNTETLAVTMRTPGADFDLAVGFLLSEGVIADRHDIVGIAYCTDEDLTPEERPNVVTVTLRGGNLPELEHFRRHFTISSACGVCGRTTIDDLVQRGIRPPEGGVVAADVITGLPDTLRESQRLFSETGGVHGAALFNTDGEILGIREDVGRHNAMDALVGRSLLDDKLPFSDRIVMVSGRASFELVQKAAVAGIPVFCAVSAPSALAISVAERFGMTLVAFLRGDTANVYTGGDRIK